MLEMVWGGLVSIHLQVTFPLQKPKKSVNGESCFSNHALVKTIFETPKCLKNSGFEASKLVSTKTLLLKHYYRRQGKS